MQPNREGLRLATVLLAAANIVIPIAILTFAKGFFPYKPSLPGLSKYEDVELGLGPTPDAPFDKLIFMVVDAFRSDFVFSKVVIRQNPSWPGLGQPKSTIYFRVNADTAELDPTCNRIEKD